MIFYLSNMLFISLFNQLTFQTKNLPHIKNKQVASYSKNRLAFIKIFIKSKRKPLQMPRFQPFSCVSEVLKQTPPIRSARRREARCEVVYPNGEAALADFKLTMSMNEVKVGGGLGIFLFFFVLKGCSMVFPGFPMSCLAF